MTQSEGLFAWMDWQVIEALKHETAWSICYGYVMDAIEGLLDFDYALDQIEDLLSSHGFIDA